MTVQFAQHPHAVPLHYHAAVAPRNWKKTTLAERLQYVLDVMADELGWDEAELARQMGARGQSTVQHWLKGRNKRMQSRFAWPLQDNHRWNARWLLDGEGEPRIAFVAPEKRRLVDRVSSMPVERLKALLEALGVT